MKYIYNSVLISIHFLAHFGWIHLINHAVDLFYICTIFVKAHHFARSKTVKKNLYQRASSDFICLYYSLNTELEWDAREVAQSNTKYLLHLCNFFSFYGLGHAISNFVLNFNRKKQKTFSRNGKKISAFCKTCPIWLLFLMLRSDY